MMTVIEYMRVCGTKTVQVRISYTQQNLEIAKQEAVGGEYTLKEVSGDGVC